MLKHLGHSYHGKLHTFDDFYQNNSKPIKSNDLISTNHSLPTSPCSPNSNPYTFYNIFSDLKSTITPEVVPEEDESEQDNELIPQVSTPPTPVFYLEDDHHNHPQTSSTSPHWPSLILNRFRHTNNNHHGIVTQNSINEDHMNLTKLRKSDLTDSSTTKHRFLKRSQTLNNTNRLTDKKSSQDDFPELSLPVNNHIVKKHRSIVSLFHPFHHNSSTKDPNLSNSTGTLHIEKINSNNNELSRSKLIKQKTLPLNNEINSPMKKSPSSPILPKLVSFFHLHHSSEHHKYRVGNLKARLHHRRHSPPLTNLTPKFHCQASNELIQEIKQLEQQEYDNDDYIHLQRPVKPVVMKRVHTWHNTFDLRPVDQCLEY
jgi:hypothetical protein